MNAKENIEEFLRKRIRQGGDNECWSWVGAVSSTGYGAKVRGDSPHRWVYKICFGDIPEKHVIDHVCHNISADKGECPGGRACIHRRCCNPSHLRAVTHGQNLAASPLTFNGRQRTLCKHETCQRHVDRYTGYCKTHHERFLRYGDPAIVSERLTRPAVCSVAGCLAKHHAKGFCDVHATRVNRYGDPHTVKKLQTSNRPSVCSVENCEKPHKARGWCGTHWWRWRKYGDVMSDIPIGESLMAADRAEADFVRTSGGV